MSHDADLWWGRRQDVNDTLDHAEKNIEAFFPWSEQRHEGERQFSLRKNLDEDTEPFEAKRPDDLHI